jgi:hypothetical protein
MEMETWKHGDIDTWRWRLGGGDMDMETWRWRHGDGDMEMETWNHRDMEPWRHGDMEAWRHGDMETWRHRNMETWKHGDMVTWRNGDVATWRWRNEHGDIKRKTEPWAIFLNQSVSSLCKRKFVVCPFVPLTNAVNARKLNGLNGLVHL